MALGTRQQKGLTEEANMQPIHLTASQWIERHRSGAAAMVEGRRHIVAHQPRTGEPAYIEVEVDEPDVRCAVIDGRLDVSSFDLVEGDSEFDLK